MGLGEGSKGLLGRLARAAGLSALATANMGSACGSCDPARDETFSIDELLAEREQGLAAAPAEGSFNNATVRMTAEAWNGTACPSPQQLGAIFAINDDSTHSWASSVHEEPGGKCSYHYVEQCVGGRPFLVGGRAQVARLNREGERGRHGPLAEAWLADALMEHASVAAFARLSLQLLSLGAPAELVRDAQLASLDELRHADFCFDMAARHAGAPLRPGPLPVAGALDDLSLAALIESNLREGCIGETLAAEQLRCRAELVMDPALKTALLQICEDETRHAELAFRILGWCRAQAPELTRQILERVLAEAASEPARRPATTPDDEAFIAERGHLDLLTRSYLATWQDVLVPLISAARSAPLAAAVASF
jgi:hypothetical protein